MKLLNLYSANGSSLKVIPYKFSYTCTIYIHPLLFNGMKVFSRSLKAVQVDIKLGVRKKVLRS